MRSQKPQQTLDVVTEWDWRDGEKGNLLSPHATVIFVKLTPTSNFFKLTADISINKTEVDKSINTIRTRLK